MLSSSGAVAVSSAGEPDAARVTFLDVAAAIHEHTSEHVHEVLALIHEYEDGAEDGENRIDEIGPIGTGVARWKQLEIMDEAYNRKARQVRMQKPLVAMWTRRADTIGAYLDYVSLCGSEGDGSLIVLLIACLLAVLFSPLYAARAVVRMQVQLAEPPPLPPPVPPPYNHDHGLPPRCSAEGLRTRAGGSTRRT